MARLSDKLSGLTYTPKPQSPARAGTIVQAATDTITNWTDNGWLECDGSAVSRTTYADLFSNISTKYGVGDGSTTFNLPNGPRSTDWFDLDFSSTPAGWSLTSAKGRAYQTSLGEWCLEFEINAAATAATSLTATLDGITFAQSTAISTSQQNLPKSTRAYASGSSGNIICQEDGGTGGNFICAGKAKLASKPTDAAMGTDSRFSTFDEALESIPMIKAYDDVASVSLSTAAATASTLGTVKLSSEFAAGNGVYGLSQTSQGADATEQYLVPRYQTETVALDNQFTGGTLDMTCLRIGNLVTITGHGLPTFSSSATRSSNSGVVPAAYRPSTNQFNSPFAGGQSITWKVVTDGTIQWDGTSARTDSLIPINISYVIT